MLDAEQLKEGRVVQGMRCAVERCSLLGLTNNHSWLVIVNKACQASIMPKCTSMLQCWTNLGCNLLQAGELGVLPANRVHQRRGWM